MIKLNFLRKTLRILLLLSSFPGYVYLHAADEFQWIRFNDWSGFLTFNYQATAEKSYLEDEIKSDISRGFFEGGFQLTTRGSIYHPNLLSFNVSANIMGNRTKNVIFSEADVNNSINNSYNIRMLFLKKKKINLELFTESNFLTADRRFLGRFFTDYKNTGALVSGGTRLFPFKLLLQRMRNSTQGIAFYERDETSKDVDFRVTLFKKKQSGSIFTFKSKDYTEAIHNVSYDSMEMLADFRLSYGLKGSSNVFATSTYNKMSGNYDFEIFRILTNNRHFFHERLYIGGDYELVKDYTLERDTTEQRSKVRLNHRLFESLESEIFVGGRFENSTYQSRDTFSRGFSLNYRKKIPTGSLNFSYYRDDWNSSFTSRSDIATAVEKHIFDFSEIITITRVGVDPLSIIITDSSYSQVYILDVDYQVDVIDNAVIITRLPGGNIPENGWVTVNYSYLTFPDFDMNSDISLLDAHVIFLKYFRLFYLRKSRQHHISSQFLVPPFESFTKDSVGIKIDSRFLRAEYSREQRSSSLTFGQKGWHFRANLSYKFFKRLLVSCYVSFNYMKYVDNLYYTRFNAITGNITYNPTRKLNVRAMLRVLKFETPEYLRSRTSILVRAQWTINRLILEFLYEHILESYDLSDRLHDYFSLVIRRRF
ncbi:MAG: hypothetical protein KAT34_06505 [Candidatus Aminicenantes bacterium]|nr:hypothetical protein [Candidatus Aminicenantes bacterium]